MIDEREESRAAVVTPERISEQKFKWLNTLARWVILLLVSGLLLGRREFAHLNLGDVRIWHALKATPPKFAAYFFITETTLLLLFPLALREVLVRVNNAGGNNWRQKFLNAFGWGVCAPLALIAWGAVHAIVAALTGGDTYLIFRQSALAMYPIFFIYTLLFFGGKEQQLKFLAAGVIAAALICAGVDSVGWLDPVLDANGQPPYGEWMPIYGQETLPAAILGLIYFTVSVRSWLWRDVAIAGACIAGWRQGVRPMQSVVPISMAAALGLLSATGLLMLFARQRATLKRVAIVLGIFMVLGIGYKVMRSASSKPELPGTETASEVKAWNPGAYTHLFELYESTQMPADEKARMLAWRPPYQRVDDPEVYKLQAVFINTPSVSIRNNIWRFLVWQQMARDWRAGRSIVGAGVGKAWFYRAMYSTGFHYGDDREGLDPHNSYLNTLYRYGLIGILMLLASIAVSWREAFRALKREGGDPLLEALLMYSGYTVMFAFFTVSLEGPAYSMPFWMALGAVYARARILSKLLTAPAMASPVLIP